MDSLRLRKSAKFRWLLLLLFVLVLLFMLVLFWAMLWTLGVVVYDDVGVDCLSLSLSCDDEDGFVWCDFDL